MSFPAAPSVNQNVIVGRRHYHYVSGKWMLGEKTTISGGNPGREPMGLGGGVVGEIAAFVGKAPPDNWLVCDGSTFVQADYPALHAVLGSNSTPHLGNRLLRGVTSRRPSLSYEKHSTRLAREWMFRANTRTNTGGRHRHIATGAVDTTGWYGSTDGQYLTPGSNAAGGSVSTTAGGAHSHTWSEVGNLLENWDARTKPITIGVLFCIRGRLD